MNAGLKRLKAFALGSSSPAFLLFFCKVERQVKPKLLDYMLYKKPSLDQQDVAEEKELFTPYIVAWEREIAVVKEVFSRTPKSAK